MALGGGLDGGGGFFVGEFGGVDAEDEEGWSLYFCWRKASVGEGVEGVDVGEGEEVEEEEVTAEVVVEVEGRIVWGVEPEGVWGEVGGGEGHGFFASSGEVLNLEMMAGWGEKARGPGSIGGSERLASERRRVWMRARAKMG